ncbi:MAG: 3-oxoacyl-[acyl-carrier protein] reductase [Actinomycetota bacterium]|jgi:3-oxoacyl-[acyl-carrier protein] reductase|nr:3-oxoacyl-[acyl-carrier protein] reductase [Actinomycetota bacterium]
MQPLGSLEVAVLDRSARFEGRTAVVTGGAGGLGRAICQGLATEKGSVAVVDTNADAVAETVRTIERIGARASGHVVDVRDHEAVQALMQRVYDEHGSLDILIALAGGSLGTPRDLDDITPEDLDLVVDVNVKGTFHCCRSVLPFMYRARRGAIVTTSSIGGRQPSPVTGVPYAASKAAIVGMTKKLAKEAGSHGVRVNSVAPGLFLTGRLQGMFDAMEESERRDVLDSIPLGRVPEIREAVDPVLFLAGDESSYITGVVLDINGGRFMPL